jgi:hypothetical protein
MGRCMSKKKELTLKQRRLNVIKIIRKLLTQDVREFGDFGKSKIIDSLSLELAVDALVHLEGME